MQSDNPASAFGVLLATPERPAASLAASASLVKKTPWPSCAAQSVTSVSQPSVSDRSCERVIQHRGVHRLRPPVAELVHVYVRGSGRSRSPGSCGSRLIRRARGGIALRLAPLLTRRRLDADGTSN